MKYLWLLRHGKAAEHPPAGGGDRDRPLAARGERDATAVGCRLAAGQGAFGLADVPVPEVVVCSAAARTARTAELVVEAMGGHPPLDAYQSLYGASVDTVLQLVREFDEGVASALVVGHNPTMFATAWELVGEGPDDRGGPGSVARDDRATLRDHGFPTCALAVVGLEVGSWEDVAAGCGALAGVFSPPY